MKAAVIRGTQQIQVEDVQHLNPVQSGFGQDQVLSNMWVGRSQISVRNDEFGSIMGHDILVRLFSGCRCDVAQ
ncbi:MAG: hypothetical protein Ct9H300mP19_11930 [Dehalococcoidia bacterium]|nr:MAG: hypothetical protein Ct9H300mP19_11930 [Dehalococcoidia bacterium]